MLGIYYVRDLVDWLTIDMSYDAASSTPDFDCNDGHSSVDTMDDI